MPSSPSHLQTYRPRDFVEVAGGLLFAVVADHLEMGRVACFLRYVRRDSVLVKVGTSEANELLRRDHAEYLFHSPARDVHLHGVPQQNIRRHYRPPERMNQILAASDNDALQQKVARAARVLEACCKTPDTLGVTGSVLLGAHGPTSDIDLVVYDAEAFFRARQIVHAAVARGELAPLDTARWEATYRRRGCALTFEQYVWHERRKDNKFLVDGTKVDLSWVSPPRAEQLVPVRKLSRTCLQASVIDDSRAFAYPAEYQIDHPQITRIVSYNPTYTGQAQRGETIEAAGWVEQGGDQPPRLLVGTSREAAGQWIRVISPNPRDSAHSAGM